MAEKDYVVALEVFIRCEESRTKIQAAEIVKAADEHLGKLGLSAGVVLVGQPQCLDEPQGELD